ncbi:beta-ketoacyl synthase N-terminal-like domain-containing protein [Serratia rubidaea]|uniref:beta-ketoacyl synthase N-terminal-like domain-containing protein n=1 Tax=Serratia rubidaea TaxID=61652 RepID=UPI002431997F|nr:beta-ketoacyl synthase N-terminal-like domain-containing protein [Serratia rubidaea]MCR0998209.1 hypothetical protein [Serratia rubidaea]
MKQRVIASGWGQCSPLAADVPTLIEAIAAGRCATSAPWFDNDDDWQNLRLGNNPHTARAARADAAPWQQLQPVIDEALTMAGLPASALQGPRVRVFLAGNGMRPNIADFAGYQDRNDAEDLLFFPAIKQLHADSYAQDALARRFVETYCLDWPPTSVYSASNSSLTALHLAQAGIAAGQTDVALVAGWLKIVLQDVVFMGGQDMLGNGQSQPFNNQDNSVLLADGAVALVIESEEHARRRGVTPAIAISSSVCRQSSGGRGGAFTADFRTIAQTIDGALQAAGLTPQDIACALPHANGTVAGDKAEAMALQKVWGRNGIPVVSYKGQAGYVATCSGVLDFMLAADALLQRRLLAATGRHPVDAALAIHVHMDAPPLSLRTPHLLKSGIGLDGSVIAMVLSDCREGIDE